MNIDIKDHGNDLYERIDGQPDGHSEDFVIHIKT